MNPLLFLLAGLIAIPVIISYGDSGAEIDNLLSKGMDYFSQEEYDKAISQFNKILKTDPDNIDALYNKANTLSKTGKFRQAIPLYEQVLKLDPHKIIAQLKIEEALLKVTNYRYGVLDGILEIIVRDSHGGLVGYLSTTKIKALKHQIVEDLVDSWPVIKTVNRDNHNFALHQKEFVTAVDVDTIFGFHEIPFSDKVNLPLATTWHYQIPVEKGDVVSYVYSIFRPAG
ncbi:MAG: tetratricopeptide repeat protein [Nitrosopumilaceae archaeon]